MIELSMHTKSKSGNYPAHLYTTVTLPITTNYVRIPSEIRYVGNASDRAVVSRLHISFIRKKFHPIWICQTCRKARFGKHNTLILV